MAIIEAPKLISIQEGYARFAPVSFTSIGALVALLEQVMSECQQLGLTRLLVDLRSTDHPPLSTTDRYDLSHTTAEFWDRSILLAMVARPEQIDSERFGQRVAANRGLFVAACTEEAEAIAWLLRPRGSEGTSAD
jgi:hypothetical protein